MIIGVAECNNNTMQVSNERAASSCYFCGANCPRPFYSSNPNVRQASSNTRWCVSMSTSSLYNAPYTLGVAQPNLCTYNGCSWKIISGLRTWVCCCNNNLCNVGTQPETGNTCYFCSNCPVPFYLPDPRVTEVYSSNGWCAKMSTSSSGDAVATRGTPATGLCSSRGCSWRLFNEVRTYTCCCTGFRCNTGVSTTKSTIGLLSAALMMIVMARKNF
ncbi:unnamed protein product [Adineta steineri]|uniref:Uncharacterized protein n=1 Tax=Adineta steineri TaxID=433720 RepID=A0A813VJC6_9BILA|nr:unnamed protein product [Adineta steineri]CAF0871987.1 unnamed protein product [Adineta steineri]CAF1018186.1 unnamed protein product [Adineta steineri]CAF3767617.1 unnamed protein product [Adineta steineri]CAF3842595.1 unnamed protein product [Adineta steineri]